MNESAPNPVAIWRVQLDERQDQIKSVLPAHIPLDRFKRTALSAAMQNSDLLTKCDRTSLFNAVMRAATDGLMPDGREGAIVPFKGRAQWMPMIAGIRKKVRQSGEIATWSAEVVYERDIFDYQLGDDPFIIHKPALRDRGEIIAAYSIAILKGGEKSREVMTIDEIEEVRAVSQKKDKGPWDDWYAEMCKKTVARRHSKVLPMNTDLDAMFARDAHVFGAPEAEAVAEAAQVPVKTPRNLKGKLAALAGSDTQAPAEKPPEAPPKAVERQPAPQRQEHRQEAPPASKGREPPPVDDLPTDDEIHELPPHDEDGVIDEGDGQTIEHEREPGDEREQVPDLVAIAYERGEKARDDGYSRKAVPPEYRSDDHAAEAKAWTQGWSDRHKYRGEHPS